MGRGCCATMLQCVLSTINLLTLIVGGIVAAIGVFLYIRQSDYFPSLEDYNLSLTPVAIAMIVLGVLLLLIGLFGCCGAMTGNRGMLNIYFVFMLIIIVLEILVIIFGFLSKAMVQSESEDAFNAIFNKFNNGTASDIELAAVTSLQMNLECCGNTGPDFWTNSTMFSGDKVPGSCCVGYNVETSEALCDLANAFPEGCDQQATGMIDNFMLVLLLVLLVSIVFQFFCMVIACYVKKRDSVA